MSRVGVFVCHCGTNISATVDVVKVAEEMKNQPGVVYTEDYKFMCSSPGQGRLKELIDEHKLDSVVISACSPHMHEKTFRNAAEAAGLNSFKVEMANIREQCSWVHPDKAEGTVKSVDLTKKMIEKVRLNEELDKIVMPVTKKALVIGGGIAGIQAALDIAAAGTEVIIVEKDVTLGGRMIQLSETFPTLDCSQCIMTPKMVEASLNPNITIYTFAEIEALDGYVGNFRARIRRKAKSVVEEDCTGCGICQEKCPKKVDNPFEMGLGKSKAIAVPFPQAVPNVPVIDRDSCIYYKTGKCRICEKVCGPKCIDFDQQDEIVNVDIGAVVVATGFDTMPLDRFGEYGYGKYKDVIDGLTFERMASAAGFTEGEMKRPSDGKTPETVVFIQCVGSRDESKGVSYCSKICCMYSAKQTMLYKHKVHHGKAHVFYMDIRAGGKNYEEFVRRAIEEDGANYIRGRVSRVYEKGDKLIVKGADTLSGRPVTIEADMVVLATAMTARKGADKLAQTLGISYDKYNFYSESHPKLRPVETNTAGIFLAGACQAPKDVPETVAQASAAASKVLGLLSQETLKREPITAEVNEANCIACFDCLNICPYGAITSKGITDRDGNVIKEVAEVNPAVCQGCGLCNAACRSKTIELRGFKDNQIYAEINCLAV